MLNIRDLTYCNIFARKEFLLSAIPDRLGVLQTVWIAEVPLRFMQNANTKH